MSELGPIQWSEKYEARTTPWDLGRAHPELVRRLPELEPVGSAIVPGAGRGHDAAALAGAGWAVTAIDFAPAVEGLLQEAVGEEGTVVVGDAFEYAPPQPVDLVFDHTFFCAITPTSRPRFGRWAAEVIRDGGRLVSVVFPIGRPPAEGGPPYAMSVDDIAQALGPGFDLSVDEPAVLPGRGLWTTRWAIFHRH